MPAFGYRGKLLWLMLFGVAMGYFEAAVVVYLRDVLYPGGFAFPLVEIPTRFVAVELAREAATLVMLVSLSAIAAKRLWERFGCFLIVFGVWDIFYYVWLRVTIDWPVTLLDWDVLFLIPIPWIGPVLAPSLVALLMIVVGVHLTSRLARGEGFRPGAWSWAFGLAGTITIGVLSQHTTPPHRAEAVYPELCAGGRT